MKLIAGKENQCLNVQDIETILVIGSGPIVIGQAAEFDYAGTQACISLKEEGYRVILDQLKPCNDYDRYRNCR